MVNDVRSSITRLMIRGITQLQKIHKNQAGDTGENDQAILTEIRQDQAETISFPDYKSICVKVNSNGLG